jgi:pimeloyl-ACP methyl ester carboxylesterase
MDHGENRWAELEAALEAAESAEWIEAVRGTDSAVGFLTETSMPLWVMRLYFWWQSRGDEPFVDRLYDPVPTVASLDIPSLWIFGGEDSSMPTQWSIDALEALRAEGRPIEIEVFADAEHGILLFDESDGERTLLGYAPGYLAKQVDWIRSQAGLEPL